MRGAAARADRAPARRGRPRLRRAGGGRPTRLRIRRNKPVATSLIRSKVMFSRAVGRTAFVETPDGAVVQEDGVIVPTGTYEALRKRYPTTPVLGSGNEVMLPGFVNGHHHVGL